MKERVAIWMGNFENEEELLKYTNIEYDSEGNSIPSEFEKEFSLGYYDRDLVEKKFSNELVTIEQLLEDFSYSQTFEIADLEIKKSYNSVLLIYDYEETLKNMQSQEDRKMDFIKQINYEKIVATRW